MQLLIWGFRRVPWLEKCVSLLIGAAIGSAVIIFGQGPETVAPPPAIVVHYPGRRPAEPSGFRDEDFRMAIFNPGTIYVSHKRRLHVIWVVVLCAVAASSSWAMPNNKFHYRAPDRKITKHNPDPNGMPNNCHLCTPCCK